MDIPGSHKDRYPKAKAIDAAMAEYCVAHAMTGDPVADAAEEDLVDLGQEKSARLTHAGLHGRNRSGFRDAPVSVPRFFGACFGQPDWVDTDSFVPGRETFHRNCRMALAGMVGRVLMEVFSTSIAPATSSPSRHACKTSDG